MRPSKQNAATFFRGSNPQPLHRQSFDAKCRLCLFVLSRTSLPDAATCICRDAGNLGLPHLERVLVVLAALPAVEPGEVVVDPRLGGAGHVGHVGLQAPQLDLRLERVSVAPGRTAYPILESRSRG